MESHRREEEYLPPTRPHLPPFYRENAPPPSYYGENPPPPPFYGGNAPLPPYTGKMSFPLLDHRKSATDLISGVKDQVETLHKELSLMKAFLKDSREKRNESEYVRELVKQITVVAYDAEDIIDTFVVSESSERGRGVKKMIPVFGNKNLLNVAKDIESIKTKVKEIYDNKIYIAARHNIPASASITGRMAAYL
ncbi:unnamed protein product [Fraxinus pennsylvanica]|uniref:Disease resistance N-terminal domain-containing protein n=1 Tax=Fraxinus pennsylvanica TaxID=56036 RepID=A0AAD1YRK6_9LAMI|nr:unnamed protein product [Fraxinus pennsylvanica]